MNAKENLRRVIVGLFPWLPGIVSVAGAKGKGLAIRAASGLLHLAGGPGDPAVHRVGDASKGPVITAASSVITITNPDGTTIILTDNSGVSQWVASGTALPLGQMKAEAVEGSEKVTCA